MNDHPQEDQEEIEESTGFDSVDLDEELDSDVEETEEQPDILDLSGVEKFRYKDLELTPDELDKHMLRQADYTRKTQEIAEERKYMGALQSDLEAVRENPALESEFKKVYPEKYHSYLNYVRSEQRAEDSKYGNQEQLPKEVLQRLERMDKFMETQGQKEEELKVREYSQQIEKWEDSFSKKYDLSNPVDVWTKVQALMDQNGLNEDQVNEKFVEKLFKDSHESTRKRFDDYSKNQFQQNKDVNRRASDVGKGGGMPGEAPKKLKFHDVADKLIDDMKAKGY